ncbi:MAG: hypothetical protein FWE04_01720 [Oscillospiraceae bacterium]|nr:hypothetical protein [Oscillospiraceae bacterium]
MENIKVNIHEAQAGIKDAKLTLLFKDNLTAGIECVSGGVPLEEIAKPIKECYPGGWIDIDTDDGTKKYELLRFGKHYNYSRRRNI